MKPEIKKIKFIVMTVLTAMIVVGYHYMNKTESFTILHTNDIHGRLEAINYRGYEEKVGGIARRAALIKKFETNNNRIMTVDAGDFAQGTLFFNFFSGMPDVELMHEAGYDLATFGNHEFDKGLGVTKEIVEKAKFPFVCANIRFTKDEELQKLVKPYIIKDYNGFKVAVIGLIAENLQILVNSLKDVEVADSVETAKELVKKLNPEVDMIIVLSHQGIQDDLELARSVPEIDIIIGGHSHTYMKHPKLFNTEGDKTLVVQGGEFGVHLGKLDVKIKNKEIQSYNYDSIPVTEEIARDSDIYKEVQTLSQEIAQYREQKIGEITFTMGEKGKHIRSSLLKSGSLVTEAIKYRFPDVDIVLQNSGGIRLQKTMGPGKITLADVLTLYPFENSIVILELKGTDLKSVLETSSRMLPDESGAFLQSIGLEYTVNTAGQKQLLSEDGRNIIQKGQMVSDIRINGNVLDPDKLYKIAINNYIYGGGNGYSQFKNGINATDTGVMIQDLMVNYIKETSPVSVEIKDKIHIK